MQGGKTIILEEASRLDEEVFTEVCIPLLGVSNTSLIAISTPMESENFFSQLLLAKKPNGMPLFKNLQIQLICEACRAEKKSECSHMANNLPSWKSAARGELVKELMKNNMAMWEREQAGIITTSDTSAFDRKQVDALFTDAFAFQDPAVVVQDARLYIAIDPSGGGFSQTGVCSICIDAATKDVIIVSADSSSVSSDTDLEIFLLGHFEKLRSRARFSNVLFVVTIERNFGGSVMATRCANMLAKFKPIVFVSSDEASVKNIGCMTTHTVKERSRVDIARLLRLEQLKILRPFVSLREDVLDALHKQMSSFRFIVETKSDRVKTKLTGKSFSGNDDIMMSLVLAIFWSAYALTNETCLIKIH